MAQDTRMRMTTVKMTTTATRFIDGIVDTSGTELQHVTEKENKEKEKDKKEEKREEIEKKKDEKEEGGKRQKTQKRRREKIEISKDE